MKKASNRRQAASKPNIAVAFDLDFQHATEVFQGISDYCAQNAAWNLIPLNFGFEDLLGDLVASRKIDGIIGSFVSDAWIQSLDRQGLSIVNVSRISRIESVVTVGVDDRAIGQLAAGAFLESELTGFAYAGLPGYFYSQQRRAGYADTLKAQGFDFVAAPARRPSVWESWLKTLDLPTGIFCADDFLARNMVLACRRSGLSVPKDIAVIGVGNNALDSIFAGIPLSSVALPAREIGRAAAEQMARQLAGSSDAPASIDLPPGSLFQRESSLRTGRTDAVVEKALNHIRQNLAQPLTVDLLAREAAVSRRGLEMKFQEKLKRSPYAEITRQRMELAQTLLRDTALKVYEVGARCGYPEQHQFSAAFRKATGLSPRAWRESTGQAE